MLPRLLNIYRRPLTASFSTLPPLTSVEPILTAISVGRYRLAEKLLREHGLKDCKLKQTAIIHKIVADHQNPEFLEFLVTEAKLPVAGETLDYALTEEKWNAVYQLLESTNRIEWGPGWAWVLTNQSYKEAISNANDDLLQRFYLALDRILCDPCGCVIYMSPARWKTACLHAVLNHDIKALDIILKYYNRATIKHGLASDHVQSPLCAAIQQGCDDMIPMLLEHGFLE